jgi:hypothetical protein
MGKTIFLTQHMEDEKIWYHLTLVWTNNKKIDIYDVNDIQDC